MITAGMSPESLIIAQTNVSEVCASGQRITLKKPGPGSKNKLGEAVGSGTQITLSLNVFPVRFAPFSRKFNEQVSWADKVSVVFYASMLDVTAANYTAEKLKDFKIVTHELTGIEYTLSQVERYSPFGTDYLYMLIGASK